MHIWVKKLEANQARKYLSEKGEGGEWLLQTTHILY